jgi:hypothetical protein
VLIDPVVRQSGWNMMRHRVLAHRAAMAGVDLLSVRWSVDLSLGWVHGFVARWQPAGRCHGQWPEQRCVLALLGRPNSFLGLVEQAVGRKERKKCFSNFLKCYYMYFLV